MLKLWFHLSCILAPHTSPPSFFHPHSYFSMFGHVYSYPLNEQNGGSNLVIFSMSYPSSLGPRPPGIPSLDSPHLGASEAICNPKSIEAQEEKNATSVNGFQ